MSIPCMTIVPWSHTSLHTPCLVWFLKTILLWAVQSHSAWHQAMSNIFSSHYQLLIPFAKQVCLWFWCVLAWSPFGISKSIDQVFEWRFRCQEYLPSVPFKTRGSIVRMERRKPNRLFACRKEPRFGLLMELFLQLSGVVLNCKGCSDLFGSHLNSSSY